LTANLSAAIPTRTASGLSGRFFRSLALSAPLLSNDLLLAQNVQPKAASPGTVHDSAPPSGASQSSSPLSGFMPLLMMAVIFVPFFLLMSRRQKKEQQARASLKKGDRVTTNAGIIGELIEVDDRIAKVKVAPGVTVQFVANMVSPYVEAPQKGVTPAPAKDLKEARGTASDKK
jgi:preprotein translocase subunit YajC